MERFDKKNNAFAKLWIRLGTFIRTVLGDWGSDNGAAGDCGYYFRVVEAVNGSISVGEFVAFAAYNSTLVWANPRPWAFSLI